jgi:putative ribosome biogenesis GTPase RsgA
LEKIILREEQSQAIEKVKEFLNSKEIAFSITGAAGTGKTSIMNYLYNELKSGNTE